MAVNLPNAITISRLVLTFVFVVALTLDVVPFWRVAALVLFVIAALSDWLDGYLARKMGLVTALGKLLDPLADKILVCAAYVYLTSLGLCPVWVTAAIIAREFLVTGLRQIAIESGTVIAADRLGKWKTAFQLTFCINCLVWLALQGVSGKYLGFLLDFSDPRAWLMPVSLWMSLALTLISGINYTWNARGLFKA